VVADTDKLSSDAGTNDWLRPLGATLALQTMSSYLYHTVPTLAPIIIASAGSGQSFVGWLAAINTLGSIAFMLAGTPLIRRFGAIRSLQAGIVVGGLGLVLLEVPSAWAIVCGSLLMGVGYGPSSPAASDILQRYAPARHRVLIFSIRQAGVPLSGVIAGLLLPYLYTLGGWHAVVVVSLGFIAATVAVVQPLRQRVDATRSPDEPIGLARLLSPSNLMVPLRAVGDAPGLRQIALAGACLAFGHGCWVAYFVTYATEVIGLSLIQAGGAFAIMQGTGIVGRLSLGWIADRIGSGLTVLRGAAFASAAISVLLVLAGPTLSYGGLCLIAALAGFAVSSWNGVQIAVVAGRVPRDSITASTSGATILVFLGFVIGPATFALLLWLTESFAAGFLATAAATVLAWPLLLGLPAAEPVAIKSSNT
jgi:MFS family permease